MRGLNLIHQLRAENRKRVASERGNPVVLVLLTAESLCQSRIHLARSLLEDGNDASFLPAQREGIATLSSHLTQPDGLFPRLGKGDLHCLPSRAHAVCPL